MLLKCKDSMNCSIIDWSSCKLKRVVDNTLAAETISMKVGIDAAIYIGHMAAVAYVISTQIKLLQRNPFCLLHRRIYFARFIGKL